MKTSKSTSCALLPVLLAALCVSAARAESVSLAQYQGQARSIAEKVRRLQVDPEQAATLHTEIPATIIVATGNGEITVNNKRLRDDLAEFSSASEMRRAALYPKLRDYAQALADAAEAYSQPAPDTVSAHNRLDQILARREFKKVTGPTAKDALMTKLYRWLSRMLNKLSLKGNGAFDLIQLFIHLLGGAAVAMLAAWTFSRLARPEEELPPREIIPFSPSARSWRSWLADARSLAEQQDWRNAIHMAYWAGISYLEERGAWKPNRARTPREYLHLVGPNREQYPVLAALTRKLELVWYGYGTALEPDFEETLLQLEKLGCR